MLWSVAGGKHAVEYLMWEREAALLASLPTCMCVSKHLESALPKSACNMWLSFSVLCLSDSILCSTSGRRGAAVLHVGVGASMAVDDGQAAYRPHTG